MRLAITGCNGSVGKQVVLLSLKRGHSVVGIDIKGPTSLTEGNYMFHEVDLRVYEDTLRVLQGCEGIIHLAAFPNPGDYGVTAHNSNVVISWNVLRGAAELGITRIVQASSVNVLTMVYSKDPHFEYFPIDEDHPCLPDEPYGLSKVICELQADTIVRRYPAMRIASIRLHWSVPDKTKPRSLPVDKAKNDLWGYVKEQSAADAFILAVTQDDGRWSGHEAFFIVAPDTAAEEDSRLLRERFWPKVTITEGKDVSGNKGFFDCGKAQRLLGWVHRDSFLEE